MKILVLGNWGNIRLENHKFNKKWKYIGNEVDSFGHACIRLGKKIASLKHTVIVTSLEQNSAGRWVFQGIVDFLRTNPGGGVNNIIIEILETNSSAYTSDVKHLLRTYSKFIFRRVVQEWWLEIFRITLEETGAVITIGGDWETYLIGYVAIKSSKIVIPIGAFGGASVDLFTLLRSENRDIDFVESLKILNTPWSEYRMRDEDRQLELFTNKISEILDSLTKRILIIHGRSEDWKNLEKCLKQIKIKNVKLDMKVMENESGSGGKTLPEKFESIASVVDCAIAIITPDDIGGLKGKEEFRSRARQNVWLEVGYIWGRLGRDRILFLIKTEDNDSKIEIPSDLAGVEEVRYTKDPCERLSDIENFIMKCIG